MGYACDVAHHIRRWEVWNGRLKGREGRLAVTLHLRGRGSGFSMLRREQVLIVCVRLPHAQEAEEATCLLKSVPLLVCILSQAFQTGCSLKPLMKNLKHKRHGLCLLRLWFTSVVLKLYRTSEPPGELAKMQIAGLVACRS